MRSWSIQVGGASKSELVARLSHAQVQINDTGRALFAHPGFRTTESPATVHLTQLTVAELGLRRATFAEIIQAAAHRGLTPCELEVAAHLRLQFTTQPEGAAGHPPSRNEAPPGAITVASLPISEDDEDPKGFYLRRIDGVLWLRGYRSWAGHLWKATDEFVFAGHAT